MATEKWARSLACLLIYGKKFMSRRHCIQMSGDPRETHVPYPWASSVGFRKKRE